MGCVMRDVFLDRRGPSSNLADFVGSIWGSLLVSRAKAVQYSGDMSFRHGSKRYFHLSFLPRAALNRAAIAGQNLQSFRGVKAMADCRWPSRLIPGSLRSAALVCPNLWPVCK